jgi:hypothetical protein
MSAMPTAPRVKAALKRLVSLPAIPGWLLVFCNKVYSGVNLLSNGDWLRQHDAALVVMWRFLESHGYGLTMLGGFVWLGYLVIRPVHAQVLAVQPTPELSGVAGINQQDWQSSIEVVGRQIIFTLRNKKWGPPRDSGFISCIVHEPNGSARLASEPFSDQVGARHRAIFHLPQRLCWGVGSF